MSARHRNREAMWEIVGFVRSVVEPQWFFAVPIPNSTLAKFWFRFCLRFRFRLRFQYRNQTYLEQFFNNKKFVQNFAFSMLKAALFPRNLASKLVIFFTFDYILCWIWTGTGMHYGSGSAKAKNCSSCGSGSGSGSKTQLVRVERALKRFHVRRPYVGIDSRPPMSANTGFLNTLLALCDR